MAGKDLKFSITGDTKAGVKSLDELATSAEKVGVQLDETRPRAQQLADVMKAVTDASVVELQQTEAAADSLRVAIGQVPDGLDVNKVVGDLRQMGLTFDEIKADADALGEAIRHADEAARSVEPSQVATLGDAAHVASVHTGELSDSARGAKSAMANMVGNSAQDLGQVSGLVGSVGVGIGQMAEYAADATFAGENLGSALGSMAKVAGPIAALALATKAVGDYMGGIQAEKALRAELVNDFFQGFKDGKTAIEVVNERLRETGEITAQVSGKGGLLNLGTEAVDLAQLYRDAGITYKQFTDDLTDPSAVQKYKDQSYELIDSDKTRALLFHDLADGLDDYQNGIGKASVKQEELNRWMGDESPAAMKAQEDATKAAASVYGEYAEGVRGAIEQQEAEKAALEGTTPVLDAYREHQAQVTEAIEAAKQASLDAAAAEQARIDTMRAGADASFALQDATDTFADTVQGLDDKIKAAGTDQEELNRIYRDAARDGTAVADATVQLAEEQAKQMGVTLTARDSLDLWNQSALTQAGTLKGPARDAILDYIGNVNGIPPEKLSDIRALIDEGKIAEAEAALNDVSVARDAAIKADAETADAERDLNNVARDRDAIIKAVGRLGAGFNADGTDYWKGGLTWVGERGPELIDLQRGAKVYDASTSKRIAAAGDDIGGAPISVRTPLPGSGGPVFNINVTAGLGVNGPQLGRDIVGAIKEFEAQAGTRWRSS